MNKKNNLYIPVIIGVVIIIVALIFLLGCERGEPNVQVPVGENENTSNTSASTGSTPTTPETTPVTTPEASPNTTQTNNMPPPVPPEPTVPVEPVTPDYNANVFCTDTDGGINYTVKGTLTIIENGTVTTTNTDYCRSATTKFKGYVFEYYCNDTAVASNQYKCPKGCSDGKCV
jgi:hypothetical protein